MWGACSGARAARASTQAGMGFRVVVGATKVVLLLCGVSLAAPAGGPSSERPGRDVGGSSCGRLQEELVEMAAVPAESRALFV